MAIRAASGAIEITPARIDISGFQIGNIDSAASTAKRFRFGFLIVNERDDRFEVGILHVNRRHTFVHSPGPDHLADLVATRILSDKRRACEIGARLPSSGVASMTEPAFGCETGLTC